MVIYKNNSIGAKDNITVEDVKNIEEYISKIYMWKEVTGEALPAFEKIELASDKWIWEVVNQNLEEFEITYEKIAEIAKEIFGEEFNKEFPKNGSETIKYDEEKQIYYITGMGLDSEEDCFLLNNISKIKNGYVVEIIEYLEDYSNEDSIIIKNLNEEEKGRVGANDNETKIQEIVKNNIDGFSKKKIYLKNNNGKLIVQKVEK